MNNSKDNSIDSIINYLSQRNYSFGNGELSPSEIKQIKKQSKDSRGTYGVTAPIGTNIFSLMEQNDDIVFQLQDFKNSELDAMIIKYSLNSQKKYIIINSDKPLINQVFAAAHEFYHYLFSFTGNTKDSIICSFSKNDIEEIKANRFAAEFLLPEEALKRELEDFFKYYPDFEDAPLHKQILFCFFIVEKYTIPLKATFYRLKEEKITSTDFLLEHYDDVKTILLDIVKDIPRTKELYSKRNNYIREPLYDLIPLLYNKGRLDESTVNKLIKDFGLSEKQIKEALIIDE